MSRIAVKYVSGSFAGAVRYLDRETGRLYMNETTAHWVNAGYNRFKVQDNRLVFYATGEQPVLSVDWVEAAAPGLPQVAFDNTITGRKNGKVKQELFDYGFPNAVQYVAQMMTWAGEFKGYKPHDWKKVPEPDICFAAAASRHCLKHILGVNGVAGGLLDDESKLYHKAHEAFNVLAELELMLTGVIKHD